MNYENYPYDIFNPMYLKNTYVQQLENWRNVEQQKNICDMVKAISDYCEAARKVDLDYQQKATDACMREIVRQMLIDMDKKSD